MTYREVTTKPPSNNTRMVESWRLKERVRREQDYLHQPRSFFEDLYRSRRAYLAVDQQTDQMHGYAIIQSDGYLPLLVVDPEHQGDGVGTRLLDSLCREHSTITCHTRMENTQALSFYKTFGFEIVETVTNYYRDQESAYFLEYKRSNSE